MRTLSYVFAALAFLTLFAPSVTMAQDYSRSLEAISQLNRIDPRQNPNFDKSSDVLGRRVLDSKNKVIGEVRDITLRDTGNIEALSVDFNRLRLGQSVPLNYQAMRINALADGYALGFNDDQIEELYPNLLAQVETAAGEGAGPFSVRAVIGAAVKSAAGEQIGTVEDVLFNDNGRRAEAILVELSQGLLRGKTVAVPFNNPAFEEQNGRKNVVLNEDMARAVKDFAKGS